VIVTKLFCDHSPTAITANLAVCIVPKRPIVSIIDRRIIITQQSSRSAPTNQTHQLNSSEAYQKLSFGFVVVLPQLLSQLIRSAVP